MARKSLICMVMILALTVALGRAESFAYDTEVYSKNSNAQKKVALTFDDGPHPILTPRILAILREYQIPATFFVIGENVKYYPEPIQEILDAGCEIGSHTYGHLDVAKLSEEQIREELIRTEQALCEELEYTVTLFRPPQGSYGDAMLRVASEMHYRTVLWSIDTEDWAHRSAKEISARVLDQIGDGDIILMHDFIGRNGNTCEALKQFIPILLSRGYEFVTVSELLS